MKRGRRLGMIALLAVVLAFSSAQGAAATMDWVEISIDHAYYYDLDADGVSDDVLVNMTCTIREGIKNPQRSEYHIYLTLPSGLRYLVVVEVLGKYSTLQMSLKMYDVATEAGWYNVLAEGFTFGRPHGYSTASYDFDPPDQTGTGEPHVELLAWVN
jgi:hypothetical protein